MLPYAPPFPDSAWVRSNGTAPLVKCRCPMSGIHVSKQGPAYGTLGGLASFETIVALVALWQTPLILHGERKGS